MQMFFIYLLKQYMSQGMMYLFIVFALQGMFKGVITL